YDHETQHAFVGDYSGQITLLKLEQNTCSVITTLKAHEGSITSLWWDPVQRLLFSGASDHSIIMWDIGGRKGRTLLLQGHQYVMESYFSYISITYYCRLKKCRRCAPQWLESDSCQKCEQPFFWNIKQMWDTKTIGLRQVRWLVSVLSCTSALEQNVSRKLLRLVDLFNSCRTSLATFHEGKHNISHMSMDISRGLMVTCGSDRIVKIWDMTPVVGCSLATGFSSR
ncbi:WDFY1 protein, partial [Mystacornis crossleyi]|nr:WDFY1 protein [Mystacornis crossleyi]